MTRIREEEEDWG